MIMTNNEVVVEFEGINFGYTKEVQILKDINFKIYKNEYICIIGHNGSGKSTISKVLSGLLKPQSGTIKLFGEQITPYNIKHLRNNIGVVFQNPDNQFVGLTVEDDIAFGLENRKVSPEEMPKIIKLAAEALGITKLLKKAPNNLSGGQKQLAAIAGIMAINPEVIIFDESTSMLDPKSKKELKELMVKLRNDLNKTVISITHDMEEVVNADRVIVLSKGVIKKIDTPTNIFINNENELELELDYPFIVKLIKELNKKGNNFTLTLDPNEFIKQCQIKK
ncbi:energy-coupling factor transporter ATPase [bacterium]|nr:energy-coupling factor transporter ATPase [bacterium]